ncbi:hypothetical protein Egran_01308 [Elaphomyces granulatus]|uniref:Amino acid transporter transmembrane domain-containing protein n=1 Tax=Elaphomyces granulatus TaxID=519963 RepID=A0A232M3D9_9EURO|nr:hypothetical protein Egran_01308 [Elaphomyces granulatus]
MSVSGEGRPVSRSRPLPISSSPSLSPRSGSPLGDSISRQASMARLASPIPSTPVAGSNTSGRRGVPVNPPLLGEQQDLPAIENVAFLPGPGQSALASALQEATGRSSPQVGTPPRHTASPHLQYNLLLDKGPKTNYGSIDAKPGSDSGMGPYEDPEVVKRHLVQPQYQTESRGSRLTGSSGDGDEFSSLKLQGGDMTRQVYRWTEDAEAGASGSRKHARSRSFQINRPQPESEVMDISSIMIPGGFRRDFLRRTRGSPGLESGVPRQPDQPRFLTSSFLEFLTLYGHFAGEELEEDDEVLGPDEFFSPDAWEGSAVSDEEPGEDSTLLPPGTRGWKKRKHKERAARATNSVTGAALLLLKSFVGTGVLFLPRAFLNGGMLFSSMVLLVVSLLSYYCFILLVNTRLKIEGSFGDIGGVLYGKHMRRLILGSIVLSQLGFVSAYIVFTSENLQAFILAVSKCKTFIDIKFMVLMQLIIFLPLSLIRDISKLGFTALIADVFIMLGLIYLYYYDIFTIVQQGGASDISAFNPSTWTLFIGTAIFTYEGVGLIIPIQESMRSPHKFPAVLAGVMVAITIIFLSAGALSYAAYGSATKTVVILNLPQDDKFVNVVQFLYSLAILLSTPLQLFPAIRIMENELFTRSGKYNPGIKWKKNFFRFVLVMLCAFVAWGGAEDLDKFVSLVGSFACVPLVYVYPPLLHLKACSQSRWQRIADIALICLGIIGCTYTTTLTLYNWVAKDVVVVPGYCDI